MFFEIQWNNGQPKIAAAGDEVPEVFQPKKRAEGSSGIHLPLLDILDLHSIN